MCTDYSTAVYCVRTRARLSLGWAWGGFRESRNRAVHRSNITEDTALLHTTPLTERRQRGARSLGVPLWARRFSSALLSSENFTPPRWRPEKGLPARLHLSDCRSRMRPTPSKPCALSPPPPHQPRHICSTPSNLVARWPPRHGCAVPATWRACLAASARCWRSCGEEQGGGTGRQRHTSHQQAGAARCSEAKRASGDRG